VNATDIAINPKASKIGQFASGTFSEHQFSWGGLSSVAITLWFCPFSKPAQRSFPGRTDFRRRYLSNPSE